MKIIKSSLCILLAIYINDSCAQHTYTIDTTSRGNKMLFGEVTPDDFQQAPFVDWYKENYTAHQIDETLVTDKSKKQLAKYDVTIYMGTWCGDSRKEVPAVVKYLEANDYDMSRLKIVALNQNKQARDRQEIGRNIHRVPAIIFSQDNKEKGRIVEHPVVSIEQDITDIISTKKYRPYYVGLEVLHDAISKKGFAVLNDDKFIAKLKPMVTKDYELYKYGVIYFRNNEYDKALAIYDFNAKLFPESARPFQNKGISYYKLGELEKAKYNLEKALKINPKNKYAKQYLSAVEDAEKTISKK